jgi:radical SAM superfamily enzyme YgiQ (UPF0313 family)
MTSKKNLRRGTSVLLIQPPVFRKPKPWETSPLIDEFWDSVSVMGTQYGDQDIEPNHGLLYVASALRKADFSVEIVDFHFQDILLRNERRRYINKDDIRGILSQKKLEYVGISCLTPNAHWAKKISDIVKSINPASYVFVGGIFATFASEHILSKWKNVDAVVRGEGEITAVELLDRKVNNKNLEGVLGISYRATNGELKDTPDRPLIKDLDSIPYPAYDLLPKECPRLVPRIQLARGCKYNCTFCAPRVLWRNRVRYRDPKKVVDQIAYLIDKHNVRYFLIGDLTFFQKDENQTRNYYVELCNEISRRKLDIKWWCQTRVELVTDECARLLSKAGCVQVGLGIEIASQRARDAVKKENDIHDTRKACRYLKQNGIAVQAYIMIGLPEETIDDAFHTIKMIEELIQENLIDLTNIAVLVPYPCLEFCADAKNDAIRILDRDFSDYYMGVCRWINPMPTYETPYLSRFQIRALWELALATAAKNHRMKSNEKVSGRKSAK